MAVFDFQEEKKKKYCTTCYTILPAPNQYIK
jgi:hypothetical protein